jgi:hypothetical protein
VRVNRNDLAFLARLAQAEPVVLAIPVVRSGGTLFPVLAPLDGDLGISGVRVRALRGYRNSREAFWRKVLVVASAAVDLARETRAARSVVVFMPGPVGFVGLLEAWALRRPRLVYVGGDWAPSTGSAGAGHVSATARLRAALQGLAFRLSPAYMVRDPSLASRLSAAGRTARVSGALTSIEPGGRRDDRCSSRPIVCLSVCSLVPAKGVEDLLRALAIAVGRGLDLELWHAGNADPDHAARVRALARTLGLEPRVRFLGYLGQPALEDAYRRADVFVLASRTEGSPRVLPEAMGFGIPVVATRVGGIPAVVEDRVSGLLVDPAAPAQIADALRLVVDDGDLRRSLIANGWSRAHEIASMPAVWEDVLELLRAQVGAA